MLLPDRVPLYGPCWPPLINRLHDFLGPAHRIRDCAASSRRQTERAFGQRGYSPLRCRERHDPCRGDTAKPTTAPVHGGKLLVDTLLYFCKHGNMATATARKTSEKVAKYADMFSAMGTEARLRIMQLLLSAHPDGMVVGEIQEELDIPSSTLSHHLDKLRMEDLVKVRRQSTFLRYTANTDALQEVLQFLYAECCTRNKAVKPERIVQICR
jgi:ArsR family transcriptional regulator, arsenate/arsenite/antimonite-responsive transcriptional repressor